MISVVIPTLNAAVHLQRSLPPLVPAVADGLVRELVVSDGGSTDATLEIADGVGARVVRGAAGRGRLLIAGAAAARADWLLFLHAETALEPTWTADAAKFIGAAASAMRAAAFRYALDDPSMTARGVVWWAGVRSGALASPRGAQGLLISRKFYDSLGGFADLPSAEDVDFVRRVGRARLTMLPSRAVLPQRAP